MIPWAKPNYWGNEIQNVNDALASTWISGGGYLDKFESEFQDIFQKKHVLAVSNGTTAIHLAFLGVGIKPGDEIIIPGFCFLAAANVAIHMGAIPVFCEVDIHTWCIDVNKIEEIITVKTKAIMPVHTYGNVCEMDSLVKIAKKHNLILIEDCAESLFSTYDNKLSGVFGKVSTFSFQATKTITTGEGGLVITDDDEIARKMRLYRSHGMDRSKVIYWHELPGHNFRLTNLQAALGVAQLEEKETIILNRNRVYDLYQKQLVNFEGITLQSFNKNVTPLVWAVALKIKVENISRNQLISDLKAKGIETRPGFYSSSKLDIYDKHSLPVCEEISENIISLPSFPTLMEEEINQICNTLKFLLTNG